MPSQFLSGKSISNAQLLIVNFNFQLKKSLQQRDCPGFSPDSLFILFPDGKFGTIAEAKVVDYF